LAGESTSVGAALVGLGVAGFLRFFLGFSLIQLDDLYTYSVFPHLTLLPSSPL